MAYHVLARKWRPKNFSELVGQDTTVQTLSNALSTGRLHHAYLFTGTRGVGKTTIARIIAKCLNCEKGVSPTPCGECSICMAIDRGQFVDLIEVDAASRTKVEDTRDLLDNVQYAPSQGRYKIYLIDEVHMLSGHSFNALLKTLEEPPEHVKFLLATTDPQKLPITILSRCLQFHLRHITPEIMRPHLEHILQTEKLTYELPALELIAQAAKGSLRDALSLLDQAIAYGNQHVLEQTTRAMLGTLADTDLYPLLSALKKENGTELLEAIRELAEQGVDFSQIMADFLRLIHKISILQVVPTAYPEWNERHTLLEYASHFSPEVIQLFYQIGIIGNRDMIYSPDAKLAFEMTLLRMLHFTVDNSISSPKTDQPTKIKPAPLEAISPAAQPSTTISERAEPVLTSTSQDWSQICKVLALGGMLKVLAENAILVKIDEQVIRLQIDPKHASLVNDKLKSQLNELLNQYYQKTRLLQIEIKATEHTTPAQQEKHAQQERLSKAKETLVSDPHVQAILQQFGGKIDEKSIKPTEDEVK